MTIHWCGTGLSSGPGLRRLIAAGRPVAVWNRSAEEARATLRDPAATVRPYDPAALAAALAPGDIVVSMLPADHHPALARAAVAARAHFVASSYIAPEVAAQDGAARATGVAVVGEVGLDPGIDHLMAHDLVAALRASGVAGPGVEVSFLSCCGGVPARPNPFRYKFSWSPLGVLKALRAPSRSIRDGAEVRAARPWQALARYAAPLPVPEEFEVYPNRDSVPYLAAYGFDPAWKVRDFQRATLRLAGWAAAWADIFAQVEHGDDAALAALAERLWHENAYAEGEADRVVLCVDLRAARAGETLWHRTWTLDAQGDERGSAMARLVSGTVALAVEAVAEGKIAPGVHAAPHDPALVARWLDATRAEAQHMARVDIVG